MVYKPKEMQVLIVLKGEEYISAMRKIREVTGNVPGAGRLLREEMRRYQSSRLDEFVITR